MDRASSGGTSCRAMRTRSSRRIIGGATANFRRCPATTSLTEIKDKLGVERVDIVDVFRKSDETPPIADEAAKLDATALWLQLGVTNDEAAYRAHHHGMAVVMDTCIGATLARLHLPP